MTQPGWYPDPSGQGQRYWDGQVWTEHTAPAAPVAPQAGPMMPGYAPVQYHQAVLTAKNPGISLLISFFIPGGGSLYNGDTSTGIIILLGYFISVPLTLILIGIIGVIGFWIWGMVDAYNGAKRYNARHGLIA